MVKMQKNAKRFCAVLLALGVLLSMSTVISARYAAIRSLTAGLTISSSGLCFLPRDLYSAVRIRRKGGIGTPTEEGDFLDDHHGLE